MGVAIAIKRKDGADQETQEEEIVVVRGGLLQVELFLLGQLRRDAVVEVVEHGDHGGRDESSDYVQRGNVRHFLHR